MQTSQTSTHQLPPQAKNKRLIQQKCSQNLFDTREKNQGTLKELIYDKPIACLSYMT